MKTLIDPILRIRNLRVEIHSQEKRIRAVDGIDLDLFPGKTYALLGESGCGKTTTTLAINRLLPNNATICEGSEIILDNIPLHQLPENKMRHIRGKQIGMIFQDPALALNPVLTIGDQILEAFKHDNNKVSNGTLKKQMIEILDKVQLPNPEQILQSYPHQLSGGMKQRIVIAIALAQKPRILLADEPTTALDITTQAQILQLIKSLTIEMEMAVLLITHDLGIVGQMADTVGVMYAGHIIEQASKNDFFADPKHPYSQQLFKALPEKSDKDHPLAVIPGQVPSLDRAFPLCRFKDRCAFKFKYCEELKPAFTSLPDNHQVRCHWYDPEIIRQLPLKLTMPTLDAIMQENEAIQYEHPMENNQPLVLEVTDVKVHFPIQKGFFKRTVGYVKAVDGVSLAIPEGCTVALVGESGCGKTTLGKTLVRLIDPTAGKIVFKDHDITNLSQSALRKYRSEFQIIFQDPASSMNPRMNVHTIIEEGMINLDIGSNKTERQDRINALLDQVGLDPTLQWRYPHELSGGQRQRVAIARALAVGAQLIVCDEPTSALDLSVQAQILNLLKSLQQDLVISYLFITHNMGVVNYLADWVAVMYFGKIVEYGPTQQILSAPQHPYTQKLLQSLPSKHLAENVLATPPLAKTGKQA